MTESKNQSNAQAKLNKLMPILHNMLQYSKEEKFCDVVFKAGKDGKRICAHRVVLCAANDKFMRKFFINIQDNHEFEIVLDDIKEQTLLEVVEYCYTGDIEITAENVDDHLAVAEMFEFFNLKQEFTKYYGNILSPTNCVQIWVLAEKNSIQNLIELAFNIALDHFMDIKQSNEFKQLDPKLVSKLLANDRINVKFEENVFDAAVEWLEFDMATRKPFVSDLLQTVRVGLIENDFFTDRIQNWCQKHEENQLFLNLCQRRITESKLARESTTFGRLYVLGGSTYEEVSECITVEEYSPRFDNWKQVLTISENRNCFGTVSMNNNLIIIGGDANSEELNRNTCLDLKTLTTRELQPMINKRSSFATAVANGFIYVIGGYGGGANLTTVERYDIKSDKWTRVAPMAVARRFATAAVLSGSIFVMGGRDNDQRHKSVECYIPGVNKWISITSMNRRRSTAQAGVANGSLYVLGGMEEDDKPTSTVERYDATEDKWILMSFSMHIPRNSFGLTIIQDWAYITGGDNESNRKMTSAEKINLSTGESVSLSPMLAGRSLLNAVHVPFIYGV